MKVQEVMERLNMTETGKAVAYIKDGLEEIEMYTKENVLSGSIVKTSGTGISIVPGTEVLSNNDFADADVATLWATSFGGSTPVTIARSTSTNCGGSNAYELQMTNGQAINQGKRTGAITVVSGVEYTLKFKAKIKAGDTGVSLQVEVGSTAGGGQYYDSAGLMNDIDTVYNITTTFTTTGTTVYVDLIIFHASGTGKIGYFDDIYLYQTTNEYKIADSNNGFGNFTTDMKLRVSGSSSNDTDKSDNTSVGYYSITSVAAGEILLNSTLTTESAGNTITVIGAGQNYMDIIANKRYYPLPTDMLSLIGVKAKNHQNNENKYREIPRMIYKPLEQDADDI